MWARSYAPRVARNIAAQQVISMTDDTGKRLPTGVYLLEIPPVPLPRSDDNERGDPSRPEQAVIVLGNRNMVLKKSPAGESLVWLTDLQSGEPVSGQLVSFYASGELIGEATTDENGIAATRLAIDPTQSWQPVLAVTGEPGDADFAVVSSEWNEGIGVWEFGIPVGLRCGPVSHPLLHRPSHLSTRANHLLEGHCPRGGGRPV